MEHTTLNIALKFWFTISLTLPFIIVWLYLRIIKIKEQLSKDDDTICHFEEMLYAAPIGYLTYSTYKNKIYQYCSRKLATVLNLKNGEKSTFNEVFGIFNHQDAEKLTFSFKNLRENGIHFEILAKTKDGKHFSITGTRINSADGNIDFNCLWFTDITKTTEFIDNVTEEGFSCRKKLENFRILIDNLPCPVWLRNEKQEITILNRSYLELLGLNDFKDVTPKNSILHDLGNTTNFLEIAKNAQESNTPQKKQINILSKGDLKKYELTETPYYDTSLKTSNTIGSLIDITEFDEAKRNYLVHLDLHLDILSSLDTAFCIINTKHNFTFANAAFLKLWNLPENFLDNSPHYNSFLDKIREQKILPEVSDFKAYKEEENRVFESLTEQREDLLYIPDGRTFRRLRAPHPDGTIIAYEDITDRLAAERKLGDLIAVQQGILDNVSDSVLIFSPALKLKYYNTTYLQQWHADAMTMDKQPSLKEVLDMQKDSLPEIEDWTAFRDDMQKHITMCSSFTLKLKNKQKLKVSPTILADTSLMLSYHKE